MNSPPLAASHPPDSPTPTRSEPWGGALLVLLTLLLLTGALLALWWRYSAAPLAPLAQYLPLDSGATLSYRVTHADGTVTYQSVNVERTQGTDAAVTLDAETLNRALARVGGGGPDEEVAAMIARAQRTDPALLVLARSVEVEHDATGPLRSSTSLLLVQPDEVSLLGVDDQTFQPPIPYLRADLTEGETLTTEGAYARVTPFQASLTLEGREGVTVPLGPFEECWRVRLELRVDFQPEPYTNRTRSWFCAGVGVVRQEVTESTAEGTRRLEALAARTAAHVASAEPPPPLQPDATGQRLPASGAALPDELGVVWSYRHSTRDGPVTTPLLAVGELLLYGTENGALIALDRERHALRWRFQTGGGLFGAPTVADGTVFFGSTDRHLYALDLASGAFRWAFRTRDAISVTPTVAEGIVYVGSEDHHLYALDARTGAERWRFAAEEAIVAPAAVAEGTVYVGSDDSALYALDATTGQLRWAFAAEDAIAVAPVVAGDVIYVASYDGNLYALARQPADPRGEVLWEYPAEDYLRHPFAVGPDALFLHVGSGAIHAVERATGRERWRYSGPHALVGAPLLVGDALWVSLRDGLLRLDAQRGTPQGTIPTDADNWATSSVSSDGRELFTGHLSGLVQVVGHNAAQPWATAPRWEASELDSHLFTLPDSLAAPPALAEERLILVSSMGRLFAVSTHDGRFEPLGRVETESVVQLPPAVASERLFVLTQGGTLIAHDLLASEERWRVETGGTSRSGPLLVGDRVLVATAQGAETTVAAYDAEIGHRLWQRALDNPFGLHSRALLHGGRLFVTAGGLHALDPTTGEPLWAYEAAAPVHVAAAGERLSAIAVGAAGEWRLVTLAAATGQAVTSVEVALPTFPALTAPPVLAGGRMVLLLNDGTTLALDAETGETLWQQPPAGEPRGALVALGETVLYQTKANHLLARSLADGRLVADFMPPTESQAADTSTVAPVLVGDTLYAAFYQRVVALALEEEP